MQQIKKIVLGLLFAGLAVGGSYFTFHFAVDALSSGAWSLLYSMVALSVLAMALFLVFVLFGNWYWLLIFSLLAVSPGVFFLNMSSVVAAWLFAIAAGLYFTGRKVQNGLENQMKVSIQHTFSIGESMLVTVLSFLVAIIVYAGIPYERVNLGDIVFDYSKVFVDKAISWQFPFYKPDMSIGQLLVMEYVGQMPVSSLPDILRRELQKKFNWWDGKSISGLLENEEAKTFFLSKVSAELPKDLAQGGVEKIASVAGVSISADDTPHTVIKNFLDSSYNRYRQYVPAVLAVSVFFAFRMVGIFVGFIALFGAVIVYLLLKVLGVVTVKKEMREKEIISF
jgi:hypothetical protein